MALAWQDEVRNARGDATCIPRRWTFVLDKGDGSEDEVGEEGVEEADTQGYLLLETVKREARGIPG
jgi:hypothetical protein